MTSHWPGMKSLVTEEFTPKFDIDEWIGLRSATYKFELYNRITGENYGEITPYVEGASLSHDTSKTIKRTLTLQLGVEDTESINPLTDGVRVYMVTNDQEFPLGQYMFSSDDEEIFSSGNEASVQLVDEMLKVDQEISTSFPQMSVNDDATFNADKMILRLVGNLVDNIYLEGSGYLASGSWTIGTRRGQILNVLSLQGDYFTPWFDNNGVMRFKRTFDPATVVPTFDFDTYHRVYMNSIVKSSNILNAPNVYIVVSTSDASFTTPIVGRYDVPPNAPYSAVNRGFEIVRTESLQAETASQAKAMARQLGISKNIVETISVSTPPDPRHDSYDVILFEDQQWLETSWSMDLVEGGVMQHELTRIYI